MSEINALGERDALKDALRKWADDCAVHVEENLALKVRADQLEESNVLRCDEIVRLKARVTELKRHPFRHDFPGDYRFDDARGIYVCKWCKGGGRDSGDGPRDQGGLRNPQSDAAANPAARRR